MCCKRAPERASTRLTSLAAARQTRAHAWSCPLAAQFQARSVPRPRLVGPCRARGRSSYPESAPRARLGSLAAAQPRVRGCHLSAILRSCVAPTCPLARSSLQRQCLKHALAHARGLKHVRHADMREPDQLRVQLVLSERIMI